jgi:8-oxo-dGTP diphosphatase
MARTAVLAAGGIVLRRERTPLIAVVRLRKRNEWVLPKGKLDDGETPRAAAEREVLEETGHAVAVHEFLGTLVYESGGRSKVVHYWRMEAAGDPVRELMDDVRAVDWLPLGEAIQRLSRSYERAFLENVGPIALESATLAATARRTRAKQPAPDRRRQVAAAPPVPSEPSPPSPQPGLVAAPIAQDEPAVSIDQAAEAAAAAEPEITASSVPAIEPLPDAATAMTPANDRGKGLIQKMRDWLRRAA